MFEGRLMDPEFRARRQVRWIDTDESGTVHFANYVRYMEETEYEFLRSRGLNVVLRDERGLIGFPRISSNIEIVRPAVFDEWLNIWMNVEENDGVQLSYQFEITDEKHSVVAKGKFSVACCRFLPGELPRAILIPDFILQQIPETT